MNIGCLRGGVLAMGAVLVLSVTARAGVMYQGQWHNTSFGSFDDISFDVTLTADTYSVTVDADGFVFGMVDPDPMTISGPRESDGSIVLNLSDDPVFGDLSGSVSAAGVVDALFTGIPPEFGIDSVSVTGTVDDTQIDLAYKVVFAGGDPDGTEREDYALGTVMAEVPEPASVAMLVAGLMGALSRRRAG